MADSGLPPDFDSGKKTMMRKDAPWFPKCKIDKRPGEDLRAVVYVLTNDEAEKCKVGVTSQLKKRMEQLRFETKLEQKIAFWVELLRPDAFAVETGAKHLMRRLTDTPKGEWFPCCEDIVARAVMLSMRQMKLTPFSLAGWPGALDESETVTEIEEVLSEPWMVEGTKGRMPREDWAPQSQSVFRG